MGAGSRKSHHWFQFPSALGPTWHRTLGHGHLPHRLGARKELLFCLGTWENHPDGGAKAFSEGLWLSGPSGACCTQSCSQKGLMRGFHCRELNVPCFSEEAVSRRELERKVLDLWKEANGVWECSTQSKTHNLASFPSYICTDYTPLLCPRVCARTWSPRCDAGVLAAWVYFKLGSISFRKSDLFELYVSRCKHFTRSLDRLTSIELWVIFLISIPQPPTKSQLAE